MHIQIIADSCCDFTQEQKSRIQPLMAPLTVTVDDTDYVDDGTANIPSLITHLAKSEKGAKSTCPTPEAYASAMGTCEACFVITLSSQLSGSNNAANVAKNMVLEEYPEKKIHVFDSLSASAGETQIAFFLHEKITQGLSFEEIIPQAEAYIKGMRTYFVLEDLGNLFKNGRMLQVAGRIASMVHLCPVMGEDGEGRIKLIAPSLGIERSLKKLTEIIQQHTAGAAEKSISPIMAFCNCLPRAEKLKARLLGKCPALKDIQLVPTGALSTMYANNGGVILAL